MAEATTTTTTPPPVTSAATTPPPATNWFDGASAESLSWIQNKQFKSAIDVVESARNSEKLLGVPAERVIKMAERMRADDGKLTPEARQIMERLGMPKEAKEYNIEIPADIGDKDLAEMMRNVFHEEGLSKDTAARIVKANNEYQAAAVKKFKDAQDANRKAQDQNLAKEWGQAFEQNSNIAKEAARTLGVDAKAIDAMAAVLGHDKTMQLFHKLGTAVGEGRFVPGQSTNTVMDPGTAKATIETLMKDADFGRRLNAGDADAIAKWQKAHEYAHPGTFQAADVR